MMLDALVSVFLLAGGVLLLIAAWGVIALPDALSRQHAATKAGTFALAMVCIGQRYHAPGSNQQQHPAGEQKNRNQRVEHH